MMQERSARLNFAANLGFDEILTNPILDIAARAWEEDRYEAFRICYRSMRRIDDLVDERKAGGRSLTESEIDEYRGQLDRWLENIRRRENLDSFGEAFVEVVNRYAIPLWPWERLCRAMEYDLRHSGFRSLTTFIRYAEGAAVAPAAVFTHLCGVRQENGLWRTPPYDIRKAARSLALFSYFVHIIRDFRKDATRRLYYFADNLLDRYGLTRSDLSAIAAAHGIPDHFRKLVAYYRAVAGYYRDRAHRTITQLSVHLDERYRVSLEIVYSLYSQIFERINPEKGLFTADELQPGPLEVKERLELTLLEQASSQE
jgi:phytoene/squalene synthetase